MSNVEKRTPPIDCGEKLATAKRGLGRELRITWTKLGKTPFLNLRVWGQDDGGSWWPLGRKGLGIRLQELPELHEAVIKALQRALPYVDDAQLKEKFQALLDRQPRDHPPAVIQVTQLHTKGLHASESPMCVNIDGWTVCSDNRGYYRAVKRVNGRLKSIYIGRDPAAAPAKIATWLECKALEALVPEEDNE